MEKICAITVAYNRPKLLKEMLEKLLNQTYYVEKIIIIDNSTNYDIENMINQEFKNNQIDYFHMEENIGASRGFNVAIKKALDSKCDYVWIMDDDTIPYENTLEEFINAIHILQDNNQLFSFLASITHGYDNVPITIPSIAFRLDQKSHYSTCFNYLEYSLAEIECATFCSILVKTEAIKKVGLPTTAFYIWGEDSEYTFRLSRYYAPAYAVGKSKAFHKRKIPKALDITFEKDRNRLKNYKYLYRNNLIVLREYKGIKRAILGIISNFIIAVKILFNKEINMRIKKSLIIIQATFMFIFKLYNKKDFKKRFQI